MTLPMSATRWEDGSDVMVAYGYMDIAANYHLQHGYLTSSDTPSVSHAEVTDTNRPDEHSQNRGAKFVMGPDGTLHVLWVDDTNDVFYNFAPDGAGGTWQATDIELIDGVTAYSMGANIYEREGRWKIGYVTSDDGDWIYDEIDLGPAAISPYPPFPKRQNTLLRM